MKRKTYDNIVDAYIRLYEKMANKETLGEGYDGIAFALTDRDYSLLSPLLNGKYIDEIVLDSGISLKHDFQPVLKKGHVDLPDGRYVYIVFPDEKTTAAFFLIAYNALTGMGSMYKRIKTGDFWKDDRLETLI